MREILNFNIQNKNFLMFITAIVYILGLYSYFTNLSILLCVILSILAIIGILKNYISPKLILFWIVIFYFGFFNCTFRIKNSDELLNIAPAKCELKGQIVSIPNSSSKDKTKFFFQTDKGKTLVSIYAKDSEFSKLNIGNYYTIKGSLKIPFEAINPSQFDYGKYLKNYGTFTTFYADIQDVAYIPQNLTLKWRFLQILNDTRTRILKTHSNYLKSPNIEILGGIVFGHDAVAPPDYIKTAFINSGLLHILAASGMNVAFIYGFWYFFLRTLLRLPFKLTVVSGMGVILLYAMMTGLGASVVRATIMILFILAGKLIDRDTHSIALLSLVAMVMLIYNPAYINDVGFQLSFLVTFGLLISSNLFVHKGNKIIGFIKDAILIPLIAQLWVAPLQMFYFNSFSPYSIIANIATALILPLISFGGFISSILSIFEPISDFVCKYFDIILTPFLNLLVHISTYIAKLPNTLISTTHPNVIQVLIYYSIVLLTTILFKIYSRKILYLIIFLFLILSISIISFPNKQLEVTAFAVQNADAFLIKTPQNKYFIIDTAKSGYNGGKSQAEIIILKYLKDKGIKNIEGMILTHFDNDHSGGAVDLFKSLNVKNTYINTLSDKSYSSKKIYKTIKPLTVVKNREILYKEPDLEIKTFISNISNNDNENSIITLISYKDFSMLFMGDAGITAYDTLKNDLPKNISILKLGHHGAKNVINKKMLETLNPEYVLISVAPNDYKHPHPLTINALRKTNVLRTDIHNSIRILIGLKGLQIFSFDKDLKKYIKLYN